MSLRHLLSMADLTPGSLGRLLERALQFKKVSPGPLLAGRVLALLFQKPSLRTRVSFSVAMTQLGGQALYLNDAEVGLGTREPVADVARTLSRYVDAIAVRTSAHGDLVELARWSAVPVINALSEREHPCQTLADLLTMQERAGRLPGVSVAFVGDGNNVARSLLLGAALTGMDLRLATPRAYRPDRELWELAEALGRGTGARLLWTLEPQEAVAGAAFVYTDVWVSMGQEGEREQRARDFQGYQVTEELMALADPAAFLLHPLPAHRGEEVTEGVIEGSRSLVFQQAENRLYVQKAALVELLAPDKIESGLP